MKFITNYIKDNLWVLSSYGSVGIGTSIFYLGLYIMLIEYFIFTPFWAAVIGYLPGLFVGYLLTYHWVFKSSRNHFETSMKYLSVNGLGYLLNAFGIYVTVNIFLMDYLYSQFLVFLLVAIHNYTLNYLWTFSVRRNG